MDLTPTHATGQRDVKIPIFVFPPGSAVVSAWDDDSKVDLHVSQEGDAQLVHSTANVAGLTSLARHCLTLAQEGLTGPQHVDFDADFGFFETEEVSLRIERAWD